MADFITALQGFVNPLLWIFASIMAIATFLRFTKPVWNFFKSPQKFEGLFQGLEEKMDEHNEEIGLRMDKIDSDIAQLHQYDKVSNDVQINLLRDRLVSGYLYYRDGACMPPEVYRSFCDIYESYQKLDGNSYAERLMEHIHRIYKDQEESRIAKEAFQAPQGDNQK